MDRLFLDANVLFSAAWRPDAGIVRLWKLRRVELMTSAYAVEEARVNLESDEQRQRLEELLRRVRIVAGLAPLPRHVNLPEKDRPILQAALSGRATHLLTGDKRHFGRYLGHRVEGVWILLPARYFQRLEAK